MIREQGSILFLLVVITGIFVAGYAIGASAEHKKCQREAVDSGHAVFDSKTTEFKWLEVK